LSQDSIQALLGAPNDLAMLNVDTASFYCCDGRTSHVGLATPGGDFGELINALNEYESLSNHSLAADETGRMLVSWLNWPERNTTLYFHTDDAAVKNLKDNLHNSDGVTNQLISLDMFNPPADYRAAILSDLGKPQNHGCSIIRAMLDSPNEFSIRRSTLIPDLLAAYFTILWDKITTATDGTLLYKKLYFEILESFAADQPAEKAWLNFHANTHCKAAHRAPGFRGRTKTGAVFVNHPDAVGVMRCALARFFSQRSPDLSYDTILQALERRGRRNMILAAKKLGSKTPYYDVTVE